MQTDKVAAVIVAAGRGERAGKTPQGPKQYHHIGSRPIIAMTIDAFLNHPRVCEVVVVINPDDIDLLHAAIGKTVAKIKIVNGGSSRQHSTRQGLDALQGMGIDRVLIHDGVRPFVDDVLIDRVIAGLDEADGVLPAMPVTDTLRRADADLMAGETVSRDGMFSAQTPQGFRFDRIFKAHKDAQTQGLNDFTDDTAIAKWAGMTVKIVPGSPENVKLTWPKDIEMANALLNADRLPDVRTGNGYDVHSFEPGTAVILCGVSIPYHKKLSGHSDADVALHALTDALLATCGAGDIGTHFPPSDDRWKGAASQIFVREAVRIVRSHRGRIANADITLICEAPRIGDHREAMTHALCSMLEIEPQRVSVKATTNEKLGFIGRGEGIAAIATATVVFPGSLT